MDKFNLDIENSSQKKLRKVNNLPIDKSSTALAWFDSKPVTPANNISVTDISNFIPENSYNTNTFSRGVKNKIVFANELGILEDLEGNTIFDSDDISVSDTFLDSLMLDKKYYLNDIVKNNFVHSYYVSRYYTLLERDSYGYKGLDDFLPESSIPKSIKVIDENGFEYLNPDNGLKRYRILIEHLDLPIYSNRLTLPSKIIVLFDSPSPKDLFLVYDKVVLSSTESISSVVPQYKENINTVSIFNRISEESIVIDNSSRSKKIYSKKSITAKNNLINSTNYKSEGFEIFVPKKALSDNRTYESFNWRLIAQINRSVDVSSINNREEIDSENSLKQKIINCAVLATSAQIESMQQSQDFGSANPYVFLRLEQSPFNASKYSYVNPSSSENNKQLAMYWILNIDTVTPDTLALYDILAWSPSSPINTTQGLKIKKFIESTQGTLVLDLSKTSSGAENIDPVLTVSSSEYPLDTWTYNPTNIFVDETKHNAWPIAQSVFEKLTVDNVNYDVYSIFGRSNLQDLSTKKKVKEFTAPLAEKNIVLKNSRNKPIFASLEIAQSTDGLVRGCVLASTTPFLKYCNDIYQPSSVFDTALANNAPTNALENVFTVVAAIEGPMKLLYNACSIALLNRAFSTRIKDLRSSIYYQVSNWQSSYVINGNALLEDEKKEEYSLVKVDNESSVGSSKYSKNILSDNSSLLEFYKKSVYDYLVDQHSISLQDISTDNIKFFVEITNDDVEIANATLIKGPGLVQSQVVGNGSEIPTSYKLYMIQNQSINSKLYAYTNSPSAQFTVPGGFGPYVIRERLYKSSVNYIEDNVSKLLSSSNVYKNYSFNFSIFNSYNQSSESSLSFNAEWTATLTVEYVAKLSRQSKYENITPPGSIRLKDDIPLSQVFETGQAFSGADRRGTISTTSAKTAEQIAFEAGLITEEQARALEERRGTSNLVSNSTVETITSSNPVNNFLYTGDIQQGNIFGAYAVGKPGMLTDYIKYIQVTMREANILVAGKPPLLSGKYEDNTRIAVKNFQIATNARFQDGTVDSETKSLMAKVVWKAIRDTNPTRYNDIIQRIKTFNNGSNAGVLKYIEAATGAISLEDLPNTDGNYRKITFTGQSGPSKLVDTIFYAVPFDKIPAVTGVETQDLKNQVLKSVTITPGAFAGATAYKGIQLINATVYSGINMAGPQEVKGALAYTNNAIKIEVNKPMSECMFFAFRINGDKLGGKFGPNAEGYSLNKVTFDIGWTVDEFNRDTIIEKGYKLETQTAPVIIKFNVAGSVKGISPNKAEIIDLNGVKSTKYLSSPVSITYPTWSGESTLDLSKTKIDFSSTNYSPPFTPYSDSNEEPQYKDESISIDLTQSRTTSMVGGTFAVSNVVSSTGNPVNSSNLNLSVSSNKLIFQTSSLIYSNSNVIKSPETLIKDYWLLKADGSLIKSSKNSISVLDGLVLLVQPSLDPDKIGKPYGIKLQSFVSSLDSDKEINIDYGSFVLTNNSVNNDGFVYGFYDKNKKEFLGTNLYYVDYLSRGINNIYIAAMAIDADGNLGNSLDFFGPKTFGKIIPSSIPVKMACPIYNVEYTSSSRIGLSNIPPNLFKLQQWPLYITSGSFTKDIYINPSYGWTSWAKKYTGKTLRATYSTLKMDSVVWSPIAGKPYISVVNETPIVLSSKRYQLTQVPIATFVEPSQTKCGSLVNWVDFESRKSINEPWVSVDSSLIRNINCQTGIVDFVSGITSNPDLIRVSYTAKSNGIPLKQVRGKILPVNPFLNRSIVEPEKALHIYIKPVRIEVKSSNGDGYVWDYISEYNYDTPIDFTYNTNIFNPYNSVEYDPFALQIALVHTLSSVDIKDLSIEDLRIKGGGLKATLGKTIDVESYGSLDINKVFQEIKEASSFWDVYPPDQQAYSKGGFIIIKMPKTVLENFTSESELYSIINKNITAGVVYKIQDMEGNDWGVL